MRLAAIEATMAKKKSKIKAFIKFDLGLAFDWLRFTDGENCFEGIEKSANWGTIKKSQENWHLNRAAREAKKCQDEIDFIDKKNWISAIHEFEISGSIITPLVSGKDLRIESEEMHHCVNQYTGFCESGKCRIFSIKNETERATLEINLFNYGDWKATQIMCESNTPVSKLMKDIGSQVARSYSIAYNKSSC